MDGSQGSARGGDEVKLGLTWVSGLGSVGVGFFEGFGNLDLESEIRI